MSSSISSRASGVFRCLRRCASSFFQLAGARGLAALFGRAELLQMQIARCRFVERGGELALGKAGWRDAATARVSTRSSTLARLSSAITRVGLRLLVADGEQLWLSLWHRLLL